MYGEEVRRRPRTKSFVRAGPGFKLRRVGSPTGRQFADRQTELPLLTELRGLGPQREGGVMVSLGCVPTPQGRSSEGLRKDGSHPFV